MSSDPSQDSRKYAAEGTCAPAWVSVLWVGRQNHERLLFAAGMALLLGLLLPVGIEAAEPVWWTHVWSGDAGRWAFVSSVACAGCWLISAKHRARPWVVLLSVLGMQLGHAAFFEPDFSARPHMPGGLVHSVFLLAALAGATAVLARRPASSARLLVVLIASLTLFWPHPTGPLVEALSWGEATNAVAQTIFVLTLAPFVLAAWTLAWTRKAASISATAWIVGLVPCLWVLVGIKASLAAGGDGAVLLAIRDAVHYGAVAIALYVAFNDVAFLPRKLRVPSWIGIAAACGAVMMLAGALREAPREAPTWNLQSAQPDLHTLFADVLPELAMLADRRDWKGTQEAFDKTTVRAASLTSGLPALSTPIQNLCRDMMYPGRRRQRLESTARQINDTLRESGQPFFVDLEVVARQDRRGDLTWSTHLKTYEVERARTVQSERSEATSIWLARLDRLNLSEAQLGWTAHRTRHGVVVLGAVQSYWRQDLAPSLAGPVSGRLASYARNRGALRNELVNVLAGRGVTARQFELLLRCTRKPTTGCAKLQASVEPIVLELISRKVEAHELQHALDGMAPPAPEKLRKALRGRANADIMTASAELSAYLAEFARSPLPVLSKVHLQALARSRPGSIEDTVWQLIDRELDDRLPLQQAALEAYERLFGVPAGSLSVTSDLTS